MVCGRCAPKGSAFAKSFRFFYFNLYRRPAGAEGVRNPQQVELFAYIVVNGLYRAQFSAPRLLRNRGGAPPQVILPRPEPPLPQTVRAWSFL